MTQRFCAIRHVDGSPITGEVLTIKGADYEVTHRVDRYGSLDLARLTFAERRSLDESGVVATLHLRRIRDGVRVWADEYRDGHTGRVSRGNESAIEIHIRDFVHTWMVPFRRRPIETVIYTALAVAVVLLFVWAMFTSGGVTDENAPDHDLYR